ncbi:MAG: DUF115 domain-containing protein [Treponema sp.]|nr:DUF115 domain-containing protein [Treponema sp.]
MDKQFFFERNLLALSGQNPGLCARLSAAETTLNRYKFLESRSGETIPALIDAARGAHPLHSLIDPRREGERLISTLKDEGFLVFPGLGGGYAVEAALQRPGLYRALVIDYDINGVAELLCSREYIKILGDPRCRLMVDPSGEELEAYILEHYQPALSGGIRVFPLRARTKFAGPRFNAAGESIQNALTKVSADYSVQAYFGARWFSNIIRNLEQAAVQNGPFPPIREAAICAAGPSLDAQIPLLAEQRRSAKRAPFIIATDTSLPSLFNAGLEPDAVVSIDCQHISYYHFMAGLPPHIPLFLDLASPPLLAGFSSRPRFFSGGHPLAAYVSRRWRFIPPVDVSGANVTYACLSLAETLGAEGITLYGADFSCPRGQVYSRGAYIYPYFDTRQNRFSPKEALFSAFLYRNFPLNKIRGGGPDDWYYETAILNRYRSLLEAKAAAMETPVRAIPGRGAPIRIGQGGQKNSRRFPRIFASGPEQKSLRAFLEEYRNGIKRLPPLEKDIFAGIARLTEEERAIFITLLPLAAAVKRRENTPGPPETIEAARDYCVKKIDRFTARL